jgi:hypothetical protein
MCVKPIQYSCGAVSHISLRDHEASFLSKPRPSRDVCDCDRVMNIPRFIGRRCNVCEEQEPLLLNSMEAESASEGSEELSGRELSDAIAGEGEDKRARRGPALNMVRAPGTGMETTS